MATANKGYTDQATGANSGTWGVVLNDEALDYIDLNLGGIVAKALTNTNVTLSASESRNAIVSLTGTLTGNVIITTACIGFFFVENLTTGAFTVTVRNASVATAATILQGTRQLVISDATNGCRLGVTSEFASGTVMPFRQSAAPTGWTKDTSNYNNSSFRCVTGAISQKTDGVAFTAAFASRTITAAMLPDHGITISDPGHIHSIPNGGFNGVYGPRNSSGTNDVPRMAAKNTDSATTGITAFFSTTARGGAQSTFGFDVNYVDLIIATKN